MKVLVADDDPVSRRLLEAYLGRWGYEVRVAVDGAEAWTLYQQDEFPLVLSDWMMPGMDGVELIRKIRATDRGRLCYTILVTSKSHKEDLVEGMEAGADDFVTKPFDRDELRVRLREGERTVKLEQTVAALSQGKQTSGDVVQQIKQRLTELTARLAEVRNNIGSGESEASQTLQDAITQLQHVASLVNRLDQTT